LVLLVRSRQGSEGANPNSGTNLNATPFTSERRGSIIRKTALQGMVLARSHLLGVNWDIRQESNRLDILERNIWFDKLDEMASRWGTEMTTWFLKKVSDNSPVRTGGWDGMGESDSLVKQIVNALTFLCPAWNSLSQEQSGFEQTDWLRTASYCAYGVIHFQQEVEGWKAKYSVSNPLVNECYRTRLRSDATINSQFLSGELSAAQPHVNGSGIAHKGCLRC